MQSDSHRKQSIILVFHRFIPVETFHTTQCYPSYTIKGYGSRYRYSVTDLMLHDARLWQYPKISVLLKDLLSFTQYC